ncbi:MAG TPA: hypothetical protein VFK47_19280 [Ktedonobacteraceae bacterium]|nr:hypothetical protein [Ktedonobacteraceae bacterium]
MSNDWDESQDESEGFKNMRKQIKEQGKLLQQQSELIAKLTAGTRAADINQALADRGLDPRVAKFYPADSGTDDASVDAWVNENKELFGNRRVVDEGEVDRSVLTDSEQRGYQTLQDISNYEQSVVMDFESKLNAVQYDPQDPLGSEQKLMAAIEEASRYLNS